MNELTQAMVEAIAALRRRVSTLERTEYSQASDFLGLSDTPDSYAGASSYVVRVNAGMTGLEFAAAAAVAHNVLSATHSDSDPATLQRGDLVSAQGAGALLSRLAISAPASGYRNLLGADYGDVEPGYKALFDASVPGTISQGSAAATGSAMAAARRDHVHGSPATWAPSAHNILSATYHGDAATGTIVRGDLLVGNATPKIDRLALGASGTILRSDGTDAAWATLATAGIVGGTGTANQVAYWSGTNAITGGAALTWDNTTQRLALGAGPYAVDGLDIARQAGEATICLTSYADAASPVFRFRRAKGTFLAPGTPTSGQDLLSLLGMAYDGSAFANAAQILFEADANASAGSTPGRIAFLTTPSASTTLAERMRIASTGNVLIGATAEFSSAGKLQITGAASGIVAALRANATTPGNILEAQNSSGTVLANIEPDGEIAIPQDSKAIKLGGGLDMSAYYDGTGGYIRTDLVAASDLHVGCGTDKTVVLDEPVYVDIDFPIIVRTTGAGIPTLVAIQGNLTMPQWAVNDYNQSESQEMIHGWKEASTVYVHLHLFTNGLDATDRYVAFEVEWAWSNINGVLSAAATLSSGDLLIPANTTSKTHLLLSLGTLTLTGGKIGAHVVTRLKRVAASGTAPTNNPWIPMLQAHVECDTIGSRQIGTK